ncbi:MAG TPA: DUF3820 family protein [Nitrospiraceae bacterium]|nr:DUF3820 family protein [Nitrospiraceae bacterium]
MPPTLAERTNSGNQAAWHPGPMMPFGKYRGTPLAELPNEYLVWLGGLDDLRPPLLKHVLYEMSRRLAAIEAQP